MFEVTIWNASGLLVQRVGTFGSAESVTQYIDALRKEREFTNHTFEIHQV